MTSIFIIGFIIFTGFFFGEIIQKIKLPKISGYILAGIFLNPHLIRFIPENFTAHTELITQIALSFITFSVGGTLYFSKIRTLGKTIFAITFFEAEMAFLMVIVGTLAVVHLFPGLVSQLTPVMFIPLCILLGTLASPTDPSATLAVIHEFRAKGNVSSTIMSVAAMDDVLGIINFSFGLAIAKVFILHQGINLLPSILQSIIAILGGIGTGIVFGILFNRLTRLFPRETEGGLIVLVFAMIALCFGTAQWIHADELLATMTMGLMVVNFNPKQLDIFHLLERYVEELIFVLFFTLGGMNLNFAFLLHGSTLMILFVIFRSMGKILGSKSGALLTHAAIKVRKYTAYGLIPQGGIVIGLALIIKANTVFSDISDLVIGIIIGATIIHELIGPVFSKFALQKAGEIQGKTSL